MSDYQDDLSPRDKEWARTLCIQHSLEELARLVILTERRVERESRRAQAAEQKLSTQEEATRRLLGDRILIFTGRELRRVDGNEIWQPIDHPIDPQGEEVVLAANCRFHWPAQVPTRKPLQIVNEMFGQLQHILVEQLKTKRDELIDRILERKEYSP